MQTSALFYVEYAKYMERMHRFAEACEIFQRGKAANARPPATLAKEQAEFEARVAQLPPSALNPLDGADLRPALQALASTARHPDAARFGAGGMPAPSAVVHAEIVAAPRRGPLTGAQAAAQNRQLTIYEDSPATQRGANEVRLADWAPGVAPARPDHVHKENTGVPTTWNDIAIPVVRAAVPPNGWLPEGSRIADAKPCRRAVRGGCGSQRPTFAMPTHRPSQKLEVYVDNDDAENALPAFAQAPYGGEVAAEAVPLKSRAHCTMDGMIVATSNFRAPVRPRGLETAPPPTAAARPAKGTTASTGAEGANENVIRKYNFAALYPADGAELSFEELRARAHAARVAAQKAAAPPPPATPLVSAAPPPAAASSVRHPLSARPAPAAAPTPVAAPQTPQTVRVPAREQAVPAPAPTAAAAILGNRGAVHAPSPTINTKFALSEIQGMFQRPLPFGRGAASPSDDEAGDDNDTDTDMGRRLGMAALPPTAAGSLRLARATPLVAATPASVLRPSKGTAGPLASTGLRLDAGLVYEDSDDDQTSSAGAVLKQLTAAASPLVDADQENRPPVSYQAPSPATQPRAFGRAPPLQAIDGLPGPIPQDPELAALVPAAAAGSTVDHDFEVYEDPTLGDEGAPQQLGSVYEDTAPAATAEPKPVTLSVYADENVPDNVPSLYHADQLATDFASGALRRQHRAGQRFAPCTHQRPLSAPYP